MIKPAPVSLRIIQVLTLLSAVFIGLFFMFRVVLSFVGWGPYSSQPLPNPPPITMGQLLYEIEFILPLIVSVSGLFLCAGMSYTYKIVWFASFVYWVLICVTFSSITYSISRVWGKRTPGLAPGGEFPHLSLYTERVLRKCGDNFGDGGRGAHSPQPLLPRRLGSKVPAEHTAGEGG